MALAAVIGANGAIGSAFCNQIEATGQFSRVLRISRSRDADFQMDFADETSVVQAADHIAQMDEPLTLCIIATGLLHSGAQVPEKGIKFIDPEWMAENYRVNAIGPALVAKHFLPIMPRKQPFHFAAVSARVGSIADNRLGGWHSYRASKAALHMIIRNLGLEWAHKNKQAVIAALHPGTVDSALSAPFQAGVPDGKLFTPEYSAAQMLSVLMDLEPSQSGRIFAWDGQEIEP